MKTIEKNTHASIYICAEIPFNNRVKLGRTGQTATRRLQAIQVGNPNKVEMRFISEPMEHHKAYERNLKIAFKDSHIQGEWYHMEEWEILSLIDNIQEDVDIISEGTDVSTLIEGVKGYHE